MIKNLKFEEIQCACGCKTTFNKYDSKNRIRSYVLGHNPQDYSNKERNKKISEKLRGNNNGWSYGSVSYGRYMLRKLRKPECELCGDTNSIHIHHRDKNRRNNTPDNLQFLCQPHHVATHKVMKFYGTLTR